MNVGVFLRSLGWRVDLREKLRDEFFLGPRWKFRQDGLLESPKNKEEARDFEFEVGKVLLNEDRHSERRGRSGQPGNRR